MDTKYIANALGRRKCAVARVYVKEGSGKITINKRDRVFVKEIAVPKQITGYEYQFIACRQALLDGLLEPMEMPLDETLYIMQLMDSLRKEWGVRYPMD